MPRRYKTTTQIIPELEEIIEKLRHSGGRVLPSERSLMMQVGVSRMTLRKGLERLKERGLLEDGDRVRLISENKVVPSCNLAVAFVSSGCDYPENPVWFRVWMRLEKRLRVMGINLKSIFYDRRSTEKAWSGELLENQDIIVFTDAPSKTIRRNITALRDKALVIATNEVFVGKCECVVSLNNYNVGQLAAKMLVENGAQRPAVISHGSVPSEFVQRRDGFLDMLYEMGLNPNDCSYSVETGTNLTGIQKNIKQTEALCHAGHDGLFLISDESIMLVREVIEKFYKIPDEFKLVTLSASGACQNHASPVSAVSHGEEKICAKIIEIIEAVSKGMPFDKLTLVSPEILPGVTLKYTE